jgi:hypothetical protein
MILTLNLLSSAIFLVNADVKGIGKFLTIDFGSAEGSNCYVVATKSSGQIFTFSANNPKTYSQKVGAGTVILEAFPDVSNGWTFNHFLIDNEQFPNLCEYKTEKLDIVFAVFEIAIFNLEVSILDGYGEIWLGAELIAYRYNGDELNSVNVPIPYGNSPEFAFVPLSEPESYHLSSVLVDGDTYVDLILTQFTQTYQFPPIYEGGHSLGVTFSIDGQAEIPSGSDVTVFLSSAASLNFNNVPDDGIPDVAYGTQYETLDVLFWEITVVGTFDDQVIVALRYFDSDVPSNVDEEDLRLYISNFDTELYWKCDFDKDGKIDGQDVKIISNIIKHPKFLPDPSDPDYQEYLDLYDLDGDDDIDEDDIHVVNSMKNPEWIDITYGPVDTINNIIYGITDHFSIFRCR